MTRLICKGFLEDPEQHMDNSAEAKSNICGKLASVVQGMRESQNYWCRDTLRAWRQIKE